MVKRLIRQAISRLDATVTPICARHRILAALYYACLNPQFGREQFAVLRGKARYLSQRQRAPLALLRRNIHRIEKGLTMRPRTAVFAQDYIGETVDAYARLMDSAEWDPPTLRWAHDVLREYFRVVDPTAQIEQAAVAFREIALQRPITDSGNRAATENIPKPRAEGVQSSVQYQDFLDLCRQRRSVRWFRPQAVARDQIERAIEAALQAPSACNRQPFEFRLFLEAHTAADIAKLAMGTSGYAEQIPALIVVVGDFSSFEHERDRHLPYIDASLACMQLMLALETLGLSSCPINWPDVESLEQKMDAKLGLSSFQRPIMLIAVGYADPDGGVAYSAKKSVTRVITDPLKPS